MKTVNRKIVNQKIVKMTMTIKFKNKKLNEYKYAKNDKDKK